MQIAILHYHLNRGGVTQVIQNHLKSLDATLGDSGAEPLRVVVFFGGRHEGWSDDLAGELPRVQLETHVISQLEYDEGTQPAAEELAKALREALDAHGMLPGETVLHVHNHALGKNISLPSALGSLAEAGYSLLLQVHDFAEDLRPEVYHRLSEALGGDGMSFHRTLYPQAAQIHYATLNRRDGAILHSAGVDESRLHLLPNPVAEFGEMPSREVARERLQASFGISPLARFVLYPVRGIRRKNVGELLLWSAAAGDGFAFGLTLAPRNPMEQPSYERWSALAKALDLPCYLGVGEEGGLSFLENMVAADALITTSVAEGFGMVFLESWLAGRPLVGRFLPEIAGDFVEQGLSFDAMSESIRIPTTWFSWTDYREAFLQDYQRVAKSYGAAIGVANTLLPAREFVDFAQLTTHVQEEVIRLVASDTARCDELLALNPSMAEAILAISRNTTSGEQPCDIENNAAAVRKNYSTAQCGARLLQLYEQIVASDREDQLEAPAAAENILGSFMDVDSFYPLRVEA